MPQLQLGQFGSENLSVDIADETLKTGNVKDLRGAVKLRQLSVMRGKKDFRGVLPEGMIKLFDLQALETEDGGIDFPDTDEISSLNLDDLYTGVKGLHDKASKK